MDGALAAIVLQLYVASTFLKGCRWLYHCGGLFMVHYFPSTEHRVAFASVDTPQLRSLQKTQLDMNATRHLG